MDKMEKPLVSVIVPVFFAETYIDNCMDSLFKQTYRNLEIILVLDESSQDRSAELCEKYIAMDDRIVLVKVRGVYPGVARNAGIEKATGKYIVFLDVDDTVPSKAYEKLVSEIEKTSVDIVYGIREILTIEDNKKEIVTFDKEKIKSVPPYFCGIFSREYLNKNNIRYAGFRLGEDICFHVQLAANNPKCGYINDIVYTVHRSIYENSRVVERTTGLFAYKNYIQNIGWRKWVYEFSHEKGLPCNTYVDNDTFYSRDLMIRLINYTPEEREQGLRDYKELLKLAVTDLGKEEFKKYLEVDFDDFLNMHADEYFIIFLRKMSNPEGAIYDKCKNGEISIKYILALLKQWIISKVKSRKR